uniref:winged helix-turn-helix transcriptional regulator n=1 Tax=Marinobacterium profundum TaxID=1714300 RepID=UPI00083142B1|nr:helix-turn-helix domain-containing protein [Marinobacterium profundum]
MKSYGQFCPLAQATQLLCERWTLLIARELLAGSSRFGELQKGVPLMSPTLLSARLKTMLKSGIIKIEGEKGHYDYSLTPAGQELRPIVELLGAWGHRWKRSSLDSADLDAGLLMWDMRRSVDPAVFPTHRIVIEFQYDDAPKGARNWWLVCENNEIDLCLTDNGYEIDNVIKCSLKTMTAVWICEYGFNDAVKRGDIKVMGNPEISKKLQDWLRCSPLAKLGSLEKLPELTWRSST